MKQVKAIILRILYPPKWVAVTVPLLSFTALVFVFAIAKNESMLTYVIYTMSAYSLALICAAAPGIGQKIKTGVKRSRPYRAITASHFGSSYLRDLEFRGSISIYQGMAVNFLYTVFRFAAGIRYRSVWFISMAVYYLVLGAIRAYQVVCYKRRDARGEYRCYRETAWFLFLLNIPMGVMIVLMVKTNSGFSYPGYVIYLSALYTFYILALAIRNLVKFRRVGSPILSAAKVLNLVAAMMSVLGLQTAMIAEFSSGSGGSFRKTMNTITGSAVYCGMIIIAVYMLLRSRKYRETVKCDEQK